jgi:hypothetical protein
MWVINLLIIEIVAVFVIDYSGFIQEMEKYLTKWLKSPIPLKIPKPASCSLCMTFYSGLIYLIISHNFTFISLLTLTILLLNTRNILHLMYSFQGFIENILNWFDQVTGQY